MKRWPIILTVVFIVLISLLLFILTSSNPNFPPDSPYLVAFATGLSLMHVSVAVFFSLGLKNFTAELKTAYRLVCAGIIAYAISELQLPIGALYGLEASIWYSLGLIVPIIGGASLMFAGVRSLTKLFGVKSIWASWWLLTGASLAVGTAAYFLPMAPSATSEEVARGTMSMIAIICFIFAVCALLVFKAWRLVTPTYKKALLWLFIGLCGLVLGVGSNLIGYVTVGTKHWFLTQGHTLWIDGILTLTLLKAAHVFTNIEQEAPVEKTTSSQPLIDLVIAASSKTSNIAGIDSLLDPVRIITAQQTPGTPLSSTDQATLIRVYKGIEQYLIELEPVRRYSKDELRTLLAREQRLAGGIKFFEIFDTNTSQAKSVPSNNS